MSFHCSSFQIVNRFSNAVSIMRNFFSKVYRRFLLCTLLGVTLIPSVLSQVTPSLRVLQEAPWVISPLSVAPLSMCPVQGYWDAQQEVYYIDLTSFLREMNLSVNIENRTVRATNNVTSYEVDYDAGTFTRRFESEIQASDTLETGGFFYAVEIGSGDGFLITPPSLQRIFPAGSLTYDSEKLSLHLSQELFAESASSFRPRAASPTLGLGPVLYGRDRQILGGTQLGYRFTRTQRRGNTVDYTGSFNGQASALWGQLRADGSITYTDDLQTRTSFRQFDYLLDLPASSMITQIGLGRSRTDQWPVRQSYEGVWMSNRPLSTRHQQREAVIRGIAEPNALITALVGGSVADRVQADGQGRYKLSIPAYYGSSRAELEIVPPGGGTPTRETRYLFITEDLVPARRLYWDVQGGRDQFEHTEYGHARFSYGVSTNLTALGSISHADSIQTGTLGVVSNVSESVVVSAEVGYPNPSTRATLQLYRDRFQFQAEGALASKEGFSYYKQRYLGRLGWSSSGALSLYLYGSHFESFSGNTITQLDASSTIRVSRRTNLVLAGGQRTSRLSPDAPESSRFQWRTTLTRYVTPGPVRGRVGFQGYGGQYEDLDFAGLTVSASYRSFSIGGRVGYDFPAETVTTSFSIRWNAPWISVSNHSSIELDNPYNRQSVYGSMTLSRDFLFTRHPQVWSTAQLRPFIDINRDGARDPGEMILEGLDINVVRARTEPLESGGVQADFLAPSTPYQVVIDPKSLQGPELNLPTGTNFSFISDPGAVKQVDIPVHKDTIVNGSIKNLPLSSATLAVIVFYQDNKEVYRSAVSQRGLFSALLPPGTYRVEVQDLRGVEDLSGFSQTLNVLATTTQTLEIQ